MPLMKKCLCGNIAERHKDSNGKWFVYCENCSLAFGIDMKPCEMYLPGTGAAVFDTAEQARLAWDDWTDCFRKE
jgi:hypothetical protein